MNCQGPYCNDPATSSQVMPPDNMPSQSVIPYTGQFTIQQVLSPNFKPPYNSTSSTSGGMQTASQSGQMNKITGPYTADNQLMPITSTTTPPALTLSSIQYLNGALQTQVGNRVQVQFLIGTNTFQDRMGVLLAVGADYIILNEIETDDILFCDFYTIKFVKVFK